MRALSREPRRYIISTEWDRLHPASRLKPTEWHIKIHSGEDMWRWQSIVRAITDDQRLTDEERGNREAARRLDRIQSAIVRVENYEVLGSDPLAPTYETLTDPKRIRASLEALPMAVLNELDQATWNEAQLDLGEPERLRSLPIFSSGEEKSPPASATTDAISASAPGSSEGVLVSSSMGASG